MQYAADILVVEPEPRDAADLRRRLGRLGVDASIATSVHQCLRLLRRRIYHDAIVAVEVQIGPELLLARLAKLPSIRRLLAIGPAGSAEFEARGRSAGACGYLPRPAPTRVLALALGLYDAIDMARAP